MDLRFSLEEKEFSSDNLTMTINGSSLELAVLNLRKIKLLTQQMRMLKRKKGSQDTVLTTLTTTQMELFQVTTERSSSTKTGSSKMLTQRLIVSGKVKVASTQPTIEDQIGGCIKNSGVLKPHLKLVQSQSESKSIEMTSKIKLTLRSRHKLMPMQLVEFLSYCVATSEQSRFTLEQNHLEAEITTFSFTQVKQRQSTRHGKTQKRLSFMKPLILPSMDIFMAPHDGKMLSRLMANFHPTTPETTRIARTSLRHIQSGSQPSMHVKPCKSKTYKTGNVSWKIGLKCLKKTHANQVI